MTRLWWWDRSERTMEDERSVAMLRSKMENIMTQLESTIEEMRESLEEPEEGSDENGDGGSDHAGRDQPDLP